MFKTKVDSQTENIGNFAMFFVLQISTSFSERGTSLYFSTWTEKQILTSVDDRPWFKLIDEREKSYQQCPYAHHNC